MAKQGSIKHYRQTGAAKAPSSLPFGELAVAKDGTLFAGNESNAAIEAGVQVYTHAYNASTKVHNFTGSGGASGRVKITAAMNAGDTFAVNGTAVPAYTGENLTDELPVGRWVSFIFDGTQLNFNSGGSGLNFKVIAVATESALPVVTRENTIAVVTTTPIGTCQFDTVQPANGFAAGDVFIKCAVADVGKKIDAVRGGKTKIVLRPETVKQMETSLVRKKAFLYSLGTWKSMTTVVYENGDEMVSLTGGWIGSTERGDFGITATDIVPGVAQKHGAALYFGDNSSATFCIGGFYTRNYIDLTPYSTLEISVALEGDGGSGAGDSRYFAVRIGDRDIYVLRNANDVGRQILVDVSSINFESRIILFAYSGSQPAYTMAGRLFYASLY